MSSKVSRRSLPAHSTKNWEIPAGTSSGPSRGLPANPLIEGRSIGSLVRNPQAKWPYPALITHSPHWLGINHAIRSERFHYIHYSDGGEELYDVKADPLQRKNLANDPTHAPTKTELIKWLPKTNAEHFRSESKQSGGAK